MKKKHQAGEEYISSRGGYVPAKKRKMGEKDSCDKNCKFSCKLISENVLEKNFLDFYKKVSNSKKEFINQTTVCVSTVPTENKENDIDENSQRRKKSYKYFMMNGELSCRVCKKLYLSTWSSARRWCIVFTI